MYHTHFLVYMIKSFQKTHIWTAMITAFCCMRAATNVTVLLAFIMLFARAFQASSLFPQKYGFAKCGYILSTLCILLMFVVEFGKERADIIHEVMPTEKLIRDAKLMSGIYEP